MLPFLLLLETGLEDFNPATIYSFPELREFWQLLSYPTFQQSWLAKILLGDCHHQAECSLPTFVGACESQRFDLNWLASEVTSYLASSWSTRLDHHIQAAGTYISLIAIIIYLVHFLIWISWVFASMLEPRFITYGSIMSRNACTSK